MTYEDVKTAIDNMWARNEWLVFGPLEVYVRKSTIPIEIGNNLQIATVRVLPQSQRKGMFTQFLEFAERYVLEHSMNSIYVENVLNSKLETFLKKKGYDYFRRPGQTEEYPPNLYKIIV